jgi:uncharacterized protein (TIGR03067 family)
MNHFLLSVVACLLLLPCITADDDKKNNEPFQGKWKFVSIVANGTTVPSDQFEKAVVTITGNKRVLKDGDEVKSVATYKVDPTKTPKTIDISVSEGILKGKNMKGIYEFSGDTVTINVTLDGDERPTDFSSKADSGRLLQVFRRMTDK